MSLCTCTLYALPLHPCTQLPIPSPGSPMYDLSLSLTYTSFSLPEYSLSHTLSSLLPIISTCPFSLHLSHLCSCMFLSLYTFFSTSTCTYISLLITNTLSLFPTFSLSLLLNVHALRLSLVSIALCLYCVPSFLHLTSDIPSLCLCLLSFLSTLLVDVSLFSIVYAPVM